MRIICTVFFSVFFALAACADHAPDDMRAKPEPGTYYSYTTHMSTGLTAGYDVGSGVRLRPRNTFSRRKSPLGELVIRGNGTYEMPVLSATGRWNFEPETQKVSFTGRLEDMDARAWIARGSYHITFEFTDSDGEPATYTYEKAAENPIPDLAAPNKNFSGKLIAYKDGNTLVFDISSGKILSRAPTSSPGWPNGSGMTAHIRDENPYTRGGRIDVDVRDSDGEPIFKVENVVSRNTPATLDNFWLAEVSPDGAHILLNGQHIVDVDTRQSIFEVNRGQPVVTPAVRVVDRKSKTVAELMTPGRFTASWVQDNSLLFANEDGGISKLNIATSERKKLAVSDVQDAAPSPDGSRILVKRGGQLHVLEISSGALSRVQYLGEALETDKLDIQTMRWSPNGETILLSVTSRSDAQNLILIAVDGTVAEYVRDAQGDPLTVSSPIIGWAN